MQELRLVLIIVGTLAIAALLLHGLWSSRKENPAKFGEKPIGKLDESGRDSAGFDRDGVGSVRVVTEPEVAPPPVASRQERKEPALDFGSKLDADPLLDNRTTVASTRDEHTEIVAEEVEQPSVSQQPIASVMEPQSVSAPVEPTVNVEPDFGTKNVALESTLTIEDIERDQHLAAAATPSEPTNAQPQVSSNSTTVKQEHVEEAIISPSVVDNAAEKVVTEQVVVEKEVVAPEPTVVEPNVVEPAALQPEQQVLPPDFIVLNVHARNGELLRGNRLFNAFEQHHLIFGENAVYHRHSDLTGTGPVVFTVTNMVHPAHFPEGGCDNFETPGVAFYLMLPCETGCADQSFKLMLQTVQRIADSLGADVLDHGRSLITPRRIGEYREKALRYTTA